MDTTCGADTSKVMKRKSLFLFLFLIVSALELLSLTLNWTAVLYVVKPCIMLTLIGYYVSNTPSRSSFFILALSFCWAGDVFLLFQPKVEMFFMLGLLAFLIGHALYIISYRSLRWSDQTHELLPTQKVRFSFPIVLAGTGLIVVLFPTLGALKIPVMVYALVLMLMVMTALFRYGRASTASFWMMFTGAALFMTSDSLLALNKFYLPIGMGGFLIMLTYCSAQYLIVEGALRHK